MAFDYKKYKEIQTEAITKRLDKFKSGRLYLEVGGKLIHDGHAERVLPGFNPTAKVDILKSFKDRMEIIFCLDWDAIVSDRQLKNTKESYRETSEAILKEVEDTFEIRPFITINRCRTENNSQVEDFIKSLTDQDYKVYKRYFIEDYPKNIDLILSKDGFDKDEYVFSTRDLVVVTGPASSSGKLSTCIGQIYLDQKNRIESGYAKYELFPIWNLPIEHPVNLAYESATVDIGDYNVNDTKHFREYGTLAVNYNRDAQSFELLKELAERFISPTNFIRKYKSPTDMGVNMAGFAITDDRAVCESALKEIKQRTVWYQEIVNRGDGKKNWVIRCQSLEIQAQKYIDMVYG